MVRVLSCHHFTSQEVFSTKQEPEVIFGCGDKLFIATVHNVVEVYQVDTQECRHLLGFLTVSAIDQLVYSECGKYVATVEVKSSKQRSLTFVRLYFNWEGSDVTQPVRARIAGVPASNSQPENTGKQLEVVELPLRKSASCIQCCAVTGNLAIGIGSVMSLYRLCSKTAQLTGHCMVSAVLTGPRQGFLYDIYDGASLLASYPYTADTSKVVAGDSLLHAVTRNGLETYTLRKFAAAVHRMEDIDNIHNTCPHPNMDICLIGMRPFIAIQDISVCTSHVILLSKVESPRTKQVAGQSHWSLYALQNASVGQLYKDMLDLGLRYQNSSPPAFHQLLCEGHLLLRQALFSQEADGRTQQLKDLLCESCGLLGDYHSLPDSQDWTLALPYYNMSGLKVAAIVQQALHQMQPDRAQPGYGRVVHFLNHVLFTGEEPLETDKSTSNIILEAYSQLEPESLSKVIIKSRLGQFDDQKAVSMLRKIKRGVSVSGGRYLPRPLDVLAMAVLKLRLCEPEQAQIVLSTVSDLQLVQVLVSEHQLLRTEVTQLSHLSQLLRRHQPQALITALVALQEQDVLPFKTALQLLRGSEGEIHQNTHIRDYLEGVVQARHGQPTSQKVTIMLCDIYIQRLLEWKPPTSRPMPNPGHIHLPRGGGCFGVRYPWLDHLPPFRGVGSIKQPCLWVHLRVSPPRGSPMQPPTAAAPIQISKVSPSVSEEMCACCCCNEDLLKLQSLLCASNTSTDISQHILQAIAENMKGFLAVKLLCLAKTDPKKAVELLIDSHPSILVNFGETVFPDSQDRWSDVLHLLLQMFKDEDSLPDDRHESLTGALQGVLSCLASLMEPQAFINLLPSNGTVDFFLPYIQQCLRKHRAGEMRNRVASGQV
ncbi:PREDICTED: LOW QUALITY PROTEIN: Hermansky-Pudlak syndrome 3 protein-like [Branchiostoma belcheri]|uniref:LOW QUALITY PROTEIN: Hermansky-Pudlak syndrome 3 protein-like n=1 Tax=Branchiostoma belcheri TaxID=7741 RepID=A0A6P4ZZ64_BRABE|nr:PREDICTED: LOW QUALITY PROTEIN: Hermansky-Pudlak syndrome 3 protein-like [Branchiostoma belcheri]